MLKTIDALAAGQRELLGRVEAAERDCAQYQALCAELISALELIVWDAETETDPRVLIVILAVARDALRRAGKEI